MDNSELVSIVIPTFRHGWELGEVMFSLEEAQIDIKPEEYEIIICNDDPTDLITRQVAIDNFKKFKNVRYVEIYDADEVGITNGARCANVGVKSYAKGGIIVFVIDSTRIFTPRIIAKTKKAFLAKGRRIITTIYPYHIGHMSNEPGWTPEACRKMMDSIGWKDDPYRLFTIKADTYISKTGVIKESTFQGMAKETFMEVGGSEESFKSWGVHNIDFWRRCTLPYPVDGKQVIDVPGQWSKVGINLEIILLEGEGSFHIHHDITIQRNHGNFQRDLDKVWKIYSDRGDCIYGNIDNPKWGVARSREVNLAEF